MTGRVLPGTSRVRWPQAFRIIPTRFPPIPLFERLGDPAAWEVLAEIEALTNPRIRDEIGEIALVPPGERISGPGASWVLGAFAHKRPSRFSDGSFGVYYCARSRATAIAETRWHMRRFYQSTHERPLEVDMRVLVGRIDDRFADLRRGSFRRELDPDDWSPAQTLGRRLRAAGARGVVFPSVRDAGGQCLGAFTPRAVGIPRPQGPLRYRWDGASIAAVFDYATETWLL